MKKNIVVLTGSGISAESGISTFRDSGGLWENYKVEDVATYEAWERNKEIVIDFYNKRRSQLADVNPNKAHLALVELEAKYNVVIITQNVDDLHERAGSSNILHLHGELTKVRSSVDDDLIKDIGYNAVKIGDKCSKGSQLRPHIVWFGEPVPAIVEAVQETKKADYFIVIGTSLAVYPAAGLINYTNNNCQKFIIDPNISETNISNIQYYKEQATIGTPKLVEKLLNI